MKAYFDSPSPRVLAHRGLAVEAPENTPLAFANAISAGALYLETDVNASADGVAIISHDADLRRIAGRPERIGQLTAAELAEVDLGHGQGLVSLAEVLEGFPETRFNIDLKDAAVVEPAVQAIREAGATDRVLVTSFAEARRARAVALLPGVATSASARRFAPALLTGKAGLAPLLRRALAGIDAVQIPERALGLSTVSPAFLDQLHAAGVEVHIWTVNDPVRMEELLAAGVDGLVTDRVDFALPVAGRYIVG